MLREINNNTKNQTKPFLGLLIGVLSILFSFVMSFGAQAAPRMFSMPPDISVVYSVCGLMPVVKRSEVNLSSQTAITRTVASAASIRDLDTTNIVGSSVIAFFRGFLNPAPGERVTVSMVTNGSGSIRSTDLPLNYTTPSGVPDWSSIALSLQVDSNDNIYVFVAGSRFSTNNQQLYLFTSFDQGVTWTSQVLLSSSSVWFVGNSMFEARVDEVNNQYHLAFWGTMTGVGSGIVTLVFDSNTNQLINSDVAFNNMPICSNYLNFEGNAGSSFIGVSTWNSNCQNMETVNRTGLGSWSQPNTIPFAMADTDELLLGLNPVVTLAAVIDQPLNWQGEGSNVGIYFNQNSGMSYVPVFSVTNNTSLVYSQPSITDIPSSGVLVVGYLESQSRIKVRHSTVNGWLETPVDILPANSTANHLHVERVK